MRHSSICDFPGIWNNERKENIITYDELSINWREQGDLMGMEIIIQLE